ncbi:MAG TPA: hypothetical protein VG077_17470 [Verrucomicrobiae bacterium]|nr:hypothetical protein [Verrucomicrobiae bacterium]
MKLAAKIHLVTMAVLFVEMMSSAQPNDASPSGKDAMPGKL